MEKGVGGANGSAAVYAVKGREFVVMPFGGNDPARIGGFSPPGDALIAFALPQSGEGAPNVVTANPIQVKVGAIPDANLSDPRPVPTPSFRVVDIVAKEQSYEPNNFVAMPGEKIAVHLIVPGDVAHQGAVATSFAVRLPSGPFGLRGIVMPGKDTYFEFAAPADPGLYEYFSPFRNQRALGASGFLRVAPACPANTVPCISASGVLDAASQIAGAVAPGEAITIWGAGLGPAGTLQNTPSSGKLGTSLAGTQLLFNKVPAPLLSVGSNQIVALAPYELTGLSAANVVVVRNGRESPAATVSVEAVAPAVYTVRGTGQGQGLIYNANSSPNSMRNPATKGSAVRVVVTGTGQTNPPGIDGEILAPGSSIQPVAPTYVLIGGRRAEIKSTMAVPGFPSGVLQIEAMVPTDAPTGSDIPVVFAAADILSSPAATIAVQ